MKMERKWMLAALAGTIAMSMTACGGSGDKPKQGNTDGSGKTSAVAKEDSNAAKPALRQLMPYDRFEPNSDYTAKFLKEKTGYDVKYEMLPSEKNAANEKLNLMAASKEPFDVMKLNKEQFFKLASAGALEPLDDLLEKYGKNITAAIDKELWVATKVNGKVYAIPEGGSEGTIGQEFVIRQDWLEELNLNMPTNRDELLTVLRAFKEKKKVIPLVGWGALLGGADIAATFGVSTSWKAVDGKLVHRVQDPAAKEYLTFMNMLYKEGLIDPEWPINKGDKMLEKFTSGKAAMMRLAWWNAPAATSSLKKNFPDAKIALVPFLKNAQGTTVVEASGGVTWYTVIPKFAPNKEHAMRWMNAKLQPDLFKELVIGKEGVHHSFKDGKYFPILPKFNDDLTNGSTFLTGVDGKNYPVYWQARIRKDPVIQSYFEQMQENARGYTVNDPLAFSAQLPAIQKNLQKLEKLTEDYYINFIAGTEPLANYDKFLDKWKAEGGNDMVKEANEWYSQNKK